MKVKASEFMGRTASKKAVEVPTVVVSKRSGTTREAKAGRSKTFYNVDSLEAVVSTFDENERGLQTPAA